MIKNIPDASQFDLSAKTSFFSAWNELMRLLADFELAYPNGESIWVDESKEYYSFCQTEFERIISNAAQANELALKSRICSVSPYLLILGSEPKFKASQTDYDFTDFRTIDAIDLPNFVNAVCARKLPSGFNQNYSELRKLRNKIIHQGAAGTVFEPKNLIKLLVSQYIDLWPQKKFLNDWFKYLSNTRFSFFHDGKWVSAGLELVETLDIFFQKLEKGQLIGLTGFTKNKRRYCCHECFYNESLGKSGIEVDAFYTSYLQNDTLLHCQLCDKSFRVQRKECENENCAGNVISAVQSNEKICHTCGESQDN